MAEQTVTVGVGALSIEDVIAVARGGAKVAISDESKHEMALSRAVIDHLADDTVPHYGISTGFGALASTSIPKEQRAQLQKSLIRSHAAGAGPEVEREVVRGLLVLRLSTLCTGRTGVRPETAQVYADMLNAGITPVVYEYGSLGCSGDLAPLAACALVAMGEGEARNADGRKIGGGEALRAAGITPVDLKEKEGLALVNGTDGMLGMLCMAITDLRLLLKTADIAAAMSVEGMLGNDRVFAADLQALRPHRGQGDSAANIARMLKDSGLIEAGRPGSTVRVQDAYSLRCTPQVHGAARDTHFQHEHAERVAAEVDTVDDDRDLHRHRAVARGAEDGRTRVVKRQKRKRQRRDRKVSQARLHDLVGDGAKEKPQLRRAGDEAERRHTDAEDRAQAHELARAFGGILGAFGPQMLACDDSTAGGQRTEQRDDQLVDHIDERHTGNCGLTH